MPMLIHTIDRIARQKQRDVLFIKFHAPLRQNAEGQAMPSSTDMQAQQVWALLHDHDSDIDWQNMPERQQVLDWLDAKGIDWQPCGPFCPDGGLLLCGYFGDVYVDLPYDPAHPLYRELAAYLEHPDGRMRSSQVTFCCLPLSAAMRNQHHDAPGYGEDL